MASPFMRGTNTVWPTFGAHFLLALRAASSTACHQKSMHGQRFSNRILWTHRLLACSIPYFGPQCGTLVLTRRGTCKGEYEDVAMYDV